MKVILVNKFLYPKGGDAISTLNTGWLLKSRGHEVIFWGMDHPYNPKYRYGELFVDNVDYLGQNGIMRKIRMSTDILYSFEARRKFEALIRRQRPDLVHFNNFAHQISPSVLSVLKKYGIPSVMTMHDYKLVCPTYRMLLRGSVCQRCENGAYYNCLLNRCAKDSYFKSMVNALEMYLHHKILKLYDIINGYISPSLFLKDKLAEMGFKKSIYHLPNFINLDEYSPRYNWNSRYIVYIGRLSPEKGVGTLIEAMKGVRGAELRIFGDGSVRGELEGRVRREGIGNVRFMGYRTGDELKNEIRNSMFVVVPSEWYENNPMSVIESFALGKPVIGASIGGIPELVRDESTGYLFESGNAGELKNRIEFLLANPDKIVEMGMKAHSYIAENYNEDRFYRNLMNIYADCMGPVAGEQAAECDRLSRNRIRDILTSENKEK